MRAWWGLRFERRGMATNRGLLLDDWWFEMQGIRADLVGLQFVVAGMATNRGLPGKIRGLRCKETGR